MEVGNELIKGLTVVSSTRYPEPVYNQHKVQIGTMYHDLTAINRMGLMETSFYYFIGEEMHYQNFVDDFTRAQAEAILDLWRRI